jgi:hypothetical protein
MPDPSAETANLPERERKEVRCLACLDIVVGDGVCSCGTRPPLRYQQWHFEPLALPLLGAPTEGKTAYVEALLSLVPRLTRVWPNFGFSPATDHTRARFKEALHGTAAGTLPRPTRAPLPQPVAASRTADGSHSTGTAAASGADRGDEAPSSDGAASDVSPDAGPRTREASVPPLVFLMHGLPSRWQLGRLEDDKQVHRALTLHDTPGNDSQPLCLSTERLRLLARSRRCFMFFRVPDIEDTGSEHLSLLLDSYTETLVDCPRPAELHGKQEVIVVFTQAELASTLPAEIWRYLLKDPLWSLLGPHAAQRRRRIVFDETRLSDYLRGMAHTHHLLADWLSLMDGGANFLRLARDYGVKLRLTVVSATGAEPVRDAVIGGWQPHRVLDPLFWAFELDRLERLVAAETDASA